MELHRHGLGVFSSETTIGPFYALDTKANEGKRQGRRKGEDGWALLPWRNTFVSDGGWKKFRDSFRNVFAFASSF